MQSIIVEYFEKDLKPSIKAKIDQKATHLDKYEELVAKMLRAEVKVGLQPSSYIQETDQQVKVDPLIPSHTKFRPKER